MLSRSRGGHYFRTLPRVTYVALIGSLVSGPALSDTLKPFVTVGFNYDDNLLRLSDDHSQGSPGGSDTYRSALAGLNFERPIGRQLFSGSVDFSSVKFNRFAQLDYIGKDASGEWHWFLGEHFDGHAGASYSQSLAPFTEFHSNQRNLRTTKKQYVDGNWRFHPSFQWRGAYTKYQYDYDLQTQRYDNRKEEYLTTEFDYLAATGSTVGFQFRRLKGNYPYAQVNGTGLFGNRYVQDEAKVNILWTVTASTQILFLGGWAQRKQNSHESRVDNGTNARTIISWSPVEKLKLAAQAWREFAAIEGALVNSALTTGSSADAIWDFSAKTQASVNFKHETRKFTPSSTANEQLSSSLLSDQSNIASIGLAYKPLRTVTIKLNVFRDQRSGSIAAGTNSYRAHGAAFTASEQF